MQSLESNLDDLEQDISALEEVGSKVLIVDDEPINVLAISSLLELEQISSDSVTNGNEAI